MSEVVYSCNSNLERLKQENDLEFKASLSDNTRSVSKKEIIFVSVFFSGL